MKNPIIKKNLFYIIRFYIIQVCIILGFFVLFPAIVVFSSEQGVISKIKKATLKLDKKTQVKTIIPVPKNIVKASIKYQGGIFFTQARKNKIKRFQCSSCHNNKTVSIENASDISHSDIKIVHGEHDNLLACNTCHSKQNRDFLITAKETKIDFDHVYNMCGQCHFRQKKDWIGGAHGKRVSYWAGERVVKNCTSCHNPHSPRFKKRWPGTYSVPLK